MSTFGLIGFLANTATYSNSLITPIGSTDDAWNDLEDIGSYSGALYTVITTGTNPVFGLRPKGGSQTFAPATTNYTEFLLPCSKGTDDIIQYYKASGVTYTIRRLAYFPSSGPNATLASTASLYNWHGQKAILSRTTATSDFAVETGWAKINTEQANRGQVFGVIGRYKDINNYYLAYYKIERGATTGTIYLDKVVSGTRSNITSTAQTISDDVQHNLTFRITGTTLTVILDGSTKISTTDTSITGLGKAGIIRSYTGV